MKRLLCFTLFAIVISTNSFSQDKSYTLIWEDEFDGTSLDTSTWNYELGAHGWGNQELQNYTQNNTIVKDGILTITATKINDLKKSGSYTSSRISTREKKEFLYGKYEIRAKLPSGTGIWPAIWMLGANFGEVGWPGCGEIDIMEYVGYQADTVHANTHKPSGYGANGNGGIKNIKTCEEAFHIYGIVWDEDKIKFYIDTPDNVTATYQPENKTKENWPFDNPQFFILNVAVGGSWGGAKGVDNTIFPQAMEVDYVKVYQKQ